MSFSSIWTGRWWHQRGTNGLKLLFPLYIEWWWEVHINQHSEGGTGEDLMLPEFSDMMEQHLWGPCSSTMCWPYGITSGHGPGCCWCCSMHSCCWVARNSYTFSNIFAGIHKIEQQKSGLRWLSESWIWRKNYYGLSGLYLSVNAVVNIDKLFPCLPLSHTLKVTAQVPDWQLIIQGPINNLCLGLSPCMLHQLSSTAGRRRDK